MERSKVKAAKKPNEAVLETRPVFAWWRHGVFVLAAIAFGVVLVSISTLSRPAPQAKLLDDFETEASLARWQGSVKISTAHPAHGKNCLEVQFHSHSGVLTTSLQEGNWTGYDRLLFDVYNPKTTPIILSFRLYDAVGGDGADVAPHDLYRADRKLFLGSEWTHVEVVLKNLETSSELRSIALDQIRRLTIFADAETHPLTVFFDNFRLATGVEGDSTISASAPQDLTTRLDGRWVTILQVGPPDKISESVTVQNLRRAAQHEHQALKVAIETAEQMGIDILYSQAESTVAELGLYFRPMLAWFNNDREKERMFIYAAEVCRRERVRLAKLLTGEVRLPERDDTQVRPPPVPPYPRLRSLSAKNGFFVDQDERPFFITSVHGPSQGLLKFFATPRQHIESYSVGGGSRWTVRTCPIYEAFKKFPDTHRVGWDGWCGHLIRDFNATGGKKEDLVICLESPHTREAVERYIEREVNGWLKNPDLLFNIMAYELQYICYCERSLQMFRTWLERKHGNLERLNQLWGTHYQTFPEIVPPPTKQARPLPGTNRAQWYDWAAFNQDRFADYLVWVKSAIRKFDPVTPLAAGGSYSMLVGSNGTSGIDEEQIINRVDDVIIHEGSESPMGMDLQLALSEKPKPLCDPEMNLDQVRYLLPHMLHGKSVIQLWHWPDQPPAEHPHHIDQSLAHGWRFSLAGLSALFRTVLDSRRLSKEIAAFSSVPAEVALLYSRTSMLQIPPEMLTWRTTPYLRELENSYEASRFLDTRTTFVSEKQILQGKLSKIKLLIVPGASHLRAEVVGAIYRFVEQGGTLLVLPSSFLSNEYNRPADYLAQIGVQIRRIEQPVADRTGEVEQAYDQSFHERVVYRSQEIVDLKITSEGLFAREAPALKAHGTRQEITVSGPHQTLANFAEGPPALVSLKRGRGHIYYSATSFPRQSLNALLNQIFDAVGVSRPIRVRPEHGQSLEDVEARTASDSGGKLLYIANFNDHPIVGRVEVNGRPAQELFELRGQVKLADPRVSVPAGETLIFRMAGPSGIEPTTSTASR
jgi:glycosyl hydrolase family 42 (putative beta-galactosidase)